MLPDDYLLLVFLWGAIATAYVLFIAITFDVLTPLIFGPHFNINPLVHMLIMVVAFCQVAKGAAITYLLATERTARLSLLTLSGGLGLILAFILIHWWPTLEIVLVGTAAGDLLSYALFYIASSAWLESQNCAILVDTVSALAVLAAITFTFGMRPELTLEARCTVLGVGLLAIILQLTFGVRPHKALKLLLFRLRS